ncbi:hypothetical protein DWQ65_10585 [Treponema phagedenis]|uniref:Leader peptide processing enzyme n=1 Tax=Treponema phagedenis TaxID=162 RepID=A0A0B7GYT4_TREPH|nr:hypothetical protein [Treponema phagedenis]NVP24017.1 hypothetical protein [Treponema phagedenis]QEJ93890.1 hypothetical protein FUT79_00760 [Treponema phagedenis]QEJ99413.1 hypothetical protein FUT82_16410 [Treponema phagedenis]QEJ99817.1 hypothetical protein FUT84_00560 [Treponema phagedenis]QEK04984.1 hypothetical protein FUT83_15060 [Treponema phagedenis]
MKTKKRNTILFMIISTVFNILLSLGCIFFFWVLIILAAKLINPKILAALPIAFIAGLVLSFILYSRILRWAIKRFDLESKLESLFSKKKK